MLTGLLLAAAGSALPVIATSATWRLAVLAAAVAGLLAAARLRYAPTAGLAVLAVIAALALSGHTAGADPRAAPPSATHHPRAHGPAARQRHLARRGRTPER